MFDSPDNAVVADIPDAAARAWLAQLAATPEWAVDRLLQGAAWLGSFAALDAPQALPQFMPESLVEVLDRALLHWLALHQRQSALPQGFTAKRFAKALADAFGLMQTLSLPQSQTWCRQHAVAMWRWLGTQPSFASREPRAPFLRTLALVQPNRDLLSFWLSLCRQAHPRWAPLALFGLRRMPIDDDGTPSPGLPLALVNGLIDYGLALVQREHQTTSLKKQWLAEVDLLTAVYPMSQPRWVERFREALAVRKGVAVQSLRHWLDERYPAANLAALPRQGRQTVLQAPQWDQEAVPLLERFDAETDWVRPQLQALIGRHRYYVRETGDCSSLVPAFHQLARFFADSSGGGKGSQHRDSDWALALALESASWAPSDPRSWSAVAAALVAKGDWPRAQAVYWYARRRFPYNAHSHTQLGHALVVQGQFEQGEAVYYAAIRRFPDNPVCFSELGHTLRAAGRRDESLAVYHQAQQRFPRYSPIASALAGVLIDLSRQEEAESALLWAEHVASGSARDQQVLAQLRRRLHALTIGRPRRLHKLALRHFVSQAGDWQVLEHCAGMDLRGIDSLGLGTLWRQRNTASDGARSRAALDDAAGLLRYGRDDARWLVEQGLWLAANEGPAFGRTFFDQAMASHPGDGVLAVMGQRAHALAGEVADWQSLWAHYPEMAPLLRLAQNPSARRPAELEAALANVTQPDGQVKLDELDEGLRQANLLYDTAESPDVADLAQQDFLAARQLVSG